MLIIAFSTKTSKVLPRIFCGDLKHVAPIVWRGGKLTLYQFVRRGQIVKIPILARDIKILSTHGWRFVYLPHAMVQNIDEHHIYTCVHLAKRMIGLCDLRIQTPGALYKYLNK